MGLRLYCLVIFTEFGYLVQFCQCEEAQYIYIYIFIFVSIYVEYMDGKQDLDNAKI